MATSASIPSPPINSFHVGPLVIHFYALMYLVGIAAAIFITRRRWRAVGGDPDLVGEVALWSVPAGIVGGRIYFDVTTPMDIPHVWYGVFAVWDGGLGIWGGVALATVVGIWRLRRRGANVALFMDAVAPALLVAQGIGRIGNYFNKELFGRPTSLPWGLQIPYQYRVSGGIPAADLHFSTFQPTFLYELIFNFVWAGVLVWLGHHRKIKPPGLFALYVFGYSAYRIFEESLRIDSSVHIFGLRLNMYIASVLAIAGAVWFYRSQRRARPEAAPADGTPAATPAGAAGEEQAHDAGQAAPGTSLTVPEASAWGWWRERRLPAELLHLDTAAAGRSSTATLAATAAHAEREATRGAYVAQAEAVQVLDDGRAELAGLLGVPAAGLAFTESAEAALNALLAAWPLCPGDTVAVVPSEWGPNLDAFARRGLHLVEIPVDGGGVADLAALERMLTRDPPAVVHLDQVTSHRALVQPVAAAAALCRAAGVPLWVDAAQALGHADTACGADAIYATGRKWLTGPRGVGVLGVTEPWWDTLTIISSELEASERPADASPLWLLMAREANVAAWVGLCTAVREFTAAGPTRVWARLADVGRLTREALAGLPGWSVAGPVDSPSAITALRPAGGQDVTAVRARLLAEHGIVTTAGAVTRAPRDMAEPLLRISPHVDCTPDDLARLRAALQALR